MSDTQKKIIPKLKKQLKGFLADESGKVTKQDVLKLALGAMMIGGMANDAVAGHTNAFYGAPAANSHTNGYGGWCYGGGTVSQVVNGHVSQNVGGNCFGGTSSHGNVSHGSHGSHGSHSQW